MPPPPPRRPPRRITLTISLNLTDRPGRATLADANDIVGTLIRLIDGYDLRNRAGEKIGGFVADFEVG